MRTLLIILLLASPVYADDGANDYLNQDGPELTRGSPFTDGGPAPYVPIPVDPTDPSKGFRDPKLWDFLQPTWWMPRVFDWFKKKIFSDEEEGGCEGCEPIVINHPDYPAGHIGIPRGWYETHRKHSHKKGWNDEEFFKDKPVDALPYFDFDCDGVKEASDRKINGLVVFFDLLTPTGDPEKPYEVGMNNSLDCSRELLLSRGNLNAFNVINLLHMDVHKDGTRDHSLNKHDLIWPAIKIYNTYDGTVKHYSEYGYTDFNLWNAVDFKDNGDYVHKHSRYTDGADGYTQDYAYKEAIASGWYPKTIRKGVHLRIVAWNPGGARAQDAEGNVLFSHDVFNSILGYWRFEDEKTIIGPLSSVDSTIRYYGPDVLNMRTP